MTSPSINTMDAPIISDPCPHCGVTGHVKRVTGDQVIRVRKDEFSVPSNFFKCDSCGESFVAASEEDPLAAAYVMYRQKHGLVTPEQLKQWRLGLGLKQAELAALLGWSTATVSRYENGALQDEAHDRAIKAAMTPEGLMALVEAVQKDPVAPLGVAAMDRLRGRANAEVGGPHSLLLILRSRFAALDWKLEFDYDKAKELILYFCSQSVNGGGVARTKLNKLLWYADFLHQKHFGRPVTGMPYVRLQYGPVPECYELLFLTLEAEGLLGITMKEFDDGGTAHYHVAKRSPDLNVLTPTELQAVSKVTAELAQLNAKSIAERSHQEDAWIRTEPNSLVELEYAATLSLSL